MKVTTIVNGQMYVVLSPENNLEKEILQQINGGTASIVGSGNSIMSQNVEGSLVITKPKISNEKKSD